MTIVDVALDCRCELGEGPIWDARIGRLLFVDINGHRVHAFEPASRAHDTFDADGYVTAVALASAGGYLVTLQHDVARLDFPAKRLEPIAHIERDPETRFNDGYVDPRGRLWAGTMSLVKKAGQGALYRLDRLGHTLQPTMMFDGVTTSNGIDWSPDDRVMYYIDTGTQRIDVFDFNAEDGTIANRRPFVHIAEGEGKPDGLILDEEGFVWVALWQGRAVRRYSPEGRLVQQIDVPVSCPTKCAFGGARLDELYITSARTIITTAEQRAREPHAGSLFVTRPGVKGRAARPVG